MLIFSPDFDRRIMLPGAGACPRPVDIDQRITQFSNLVSLRVYSFAKGVEINGEAEEDELFIVLVRGHVDVDVNSGAAGAFSLRTDGGARAVYLPPHDVYSLRPGSDADVAYARARPLAGHARRPAAAFMPVADTLSVVGYAESMDISLTRLASGASFAPEGIGGALPERLVHVRSNDGGLAVVADRRLADWETLGLGPAESVKMRAERGSIDVLTVAATSA